ncbi:hypothetical protein U0070_024527 [Myodes glareolus]|uniref:Uncharacterized protein n=1 Tax=Myodes glareolus TaxID=447135 RepID=A0AAW0HNU5_MYOGA
MHTCSASSLCFLQSRILCPGNNPTHNGYIIPLQLINQDNRPQNTL